MDPVGEGSWRLLARGNSLNPRDRRGDRKPTGPTGQEQLPHLLEDPVVAWGAGVAGHKLVVEGGVLELERKVQQRDRLLVATQLVQRNGRPRVVLPSEANPLPQHRRYGEKGEQLELLEPFKSMTASPLEGSVDESKLCRWVAEEPG